MRSFTQGQRSMLALGVVLWPPGQIEFLASYGTVSFSGLINWKGVGVPLGLSEVKNWQADMSQAMTRCRRKCEGK